MATATATAVPHSFSASGVIRGYHVYQRIWTRHVGEKVTTVRKSGNKNDQFAVVVLEDETLCTVSSFFFFFWSSETSICSLRWWFSTRFPQYRKQSILPELVEVFCNRPTHFRLSSLYFLNLALLLDSF